MHWIWRSTIISTLTGFAVFIFIYYSETGTTPNLFDHAALLIVALVAFNMVGIGLHCLGRKFDAILPWNKNITARFFMEVSSGMILLALASFLYSVLFLNNHGPSDESPTFWQEYWDGAVKFGIISLVLIYVYSLIRFSIFSYDQYSVHQIDQLREERNQLNLQFEALRTQLSPHFLFNALNTISSLIYKDILLAEDFIRRLAHTYRYILRTNDQQLITMRAELEMLRSYFFMQKIKFENCIEMNINLPGDVLESMVPPLTLQMLLENALKHNLICDHEKLVLNLFASDGSLVVSNNIIQKTELLKIGNNLVDRPLKDESHKIGLKNIQSRYAFFTGKKVEIIKTQDFSVKLPLIKQQIDNKDIL